MQSCDGDDDGLRGCTDPEAINYDALAESDDGSCTYNSDRFLGIYLGGLDCEENAFIELTNDSTTLEITQGVYSTRDSVRLTISAGPTFPPLSIDGVVSENTLSVDDTIFGIPLPLLGQIVLLDVSVKNATLVYSDEMTLMGPLTLEAVYSESGVELFSSNCNYSGVQQ